MQFRDFESRKKLHYVWILNFHSKCVPNEVKNWKLKTPISNHFLWYSSSLNTTMNNDWLKHLWRLKYTYRPNSSIIKIFFHRVELLRLRYFSREKEGKQWLNRKSKIKFIKREVLSKLYERNLNLTNDLPSIF